MRQSKLNFGAALVALALAGCQAAGGTSAQDPQLFGEVYRDVIDYHVEEAAADRLALAALAALGDLDPALSVERSGDALVLRRGDVVRRFPAPAPEDTGAWGAVTGRVLAAARAASPLVAGLSGDEAEATLIDRALAGLDRFSRYAPPALAREHRAERDGFFGVGITLEIGEAEARVASVLPDTPAAAAGLRQADRIVAVDGTSVATLTATKIRERLRGDGPAGGVLRLEVARAGHDRTMTVVLQRAQDVRPTVTLEREDGIAWLRVRSFNHDTAEAAARLLRQAHEDAGAALRGIGLDLRNNPGGLLDQSIRLASLFLDAGMISTTIGRVPESYQNFPADADAPAETLPTAVLINGGSASAAEIVAAALQDAGRAVVIGTASFGKGTVQTVLRTGNGGELTVTWAELIAPGGYRLDRHGVVPTVCTAGDGDASRAASFLQHGPGELAQPRRALDDAGWARLRALCPAARTRRSIDRDLVRRLFDDPALYRSALVPAAVP